MPRKKINTNFHAQTIDGLRRSEATFRAIFETSGVGIGIMGLDRRVIDANPALCHMYGRTREELIGQTPALVTLPEDYPRSTEEFQELIEGKRDSYWDERRYVRPNGEIFWAHVTMSVVRDEDGKPLYLVGMVIDIDEQKRVVAELQTSESRSRAIFENSKIGLLILDVSNLTFRTNAAARAILDDPDLDRKLKDVYEFIHVRYQESERELFDQLLNGERDFYETERIYRRPGEEPKLANLTFSAIRDADKQVRYILGMIEDITEQKKAQDNLRESEARFRAMFEYASLGIVIGDVEKHPIAINEAMSDLLGYPREVLLTPGMDATFPDDKSLGQREFRQLVDGEINSYHVEKRLAHQDGHPIWVRQTVSSVCDPKGKFLYWVSMVENIDAQKRTLLELQESEARFRAMFDNTSVGIALTSFDRKILQVNEAAARITGYKATELLKMNPFDLALPEDRLIAEDTLLDMIAGKRETMSVERRYRRKNGEIFWGRVTYSLVRSLDRKPQYLIGLIEDINDQKLASEKLAVQEAEYLRTLEQRVEERTRELSEANLRLVNEIEHRQKAEEALAAKAVEEAITSERTRLARDLHDAVTQTLFSASLIAEVLPEMWAMDEAEARNSTEELRQLTRGALAEMRTLLLELRPAALTQARFPDLLRQLSEAVIGRARLPIRLDVSGEYEMPPEVKVAFYRIAQESLNNVVKYARATQVEIKLRLECCNVHLEVKDNGTGFDTSSVKPTSLGMRIMRERADAIHAHLTFESSPGQGTAVCLDWNEDELIPISKIITRGEK
jgi:PAS domain S-box-containing protein